MNPVSLLFAALLFFACGADAHAANPEDPVRAKRKVATELVEAVLSALRDPRMLASSYQDATTGTGIFTYVAVAVNPEDPYAVVGDRRGPRQDALMCVVDTALGGSLWTRFGKALEREPLVRPIEDLRGAPVEHRVTQGTPDLRAASIVLSQIGNDGSGELDMDVRWPTTDAANLMVYVAEIAGKPGRIKFFVVHVPITYDETAAGQDQFLRPIKGARIRKIAELPGEYTVEEFGCAQPSNATGATTRPSSGAPATARTAPPATTHASLFIERDGKLLVPDSATVRSGDRVSFVAELYPGGTPFLFHRGTNGVFYELYPGVGKEPVAHGPGLVPLLTADVKHQAGTEHLWLVVVPLGRGLPSEVQELRALHETPILAGSPANGALATARTASTLDNAMRGLAAQGTSWTDRTYVPAGVAAPVTSSGQADPWSLAEGIVDAEGVVVLHSRQHHK